MDKLTYAVYSTVTGRKSELIATFSWKHDALAYIELKKADCHNVASYHIEQ